MATGFELVATKQRARDVGLVVAGDFIFPPCHTDS
jgi:hypothetical protein